ncbi:MAG: YggT family protein [Chloroflexota bacterium]|nr:YggT family protein [Chloroflexota bacterium]
MPLYSPPIPFVSFLVKYGIGVLILAMLVRAIASWFRLDERYAFIRFLARITDPFIAPVRRIVRPVGVIDLSFIVAWFLLVVLQQLLLQALPLGW